MKDTAAQNAKMRRTFSLRVGFEVGLLSRSSEGGFLADRGAFSDLFAVVAVDERFI